MRNMLDRIQDRRRRLGKDAEFVTNEQIERQLQREDDQARVNQYADGRRNATTGY